MILSLSVSMLGTGCKTTSDPVIQIPDLSVVRPERPTLEGSYENMVKQLIVYSNYMEMYATGLEDYIVEINYILAN